MPGRAGLVAPGGRDHKPILPQFVGDGTVRMPMLEGERNDRVFHLLRNAVLQYRLLALAPVKTWSQRAFDFPRERLFRLVNGVSSIISYGRSARRAVQRL
jgi:hypothetical protein